MAAPVFVQDVVSDKPKRTRKTHHKVRTGCLTCKIRRKKCDEAKPSCNRCTSTGRKCDGYEDADAVKADKPPSPPDSAVDVRSKSSSSDATSPQSRNRALKLWRPPRSDWFQTDQDYYCFDFFRSRTGPEIAAYFDSSIWRSFMIKACFLHPTVLQAATAVGAVHRRFELGITPEAFKFCEISIRQYRKALRCLENDMNSNHPLALEVNMIVSMLFSVFEVFQGNYDAAVDLMSTGLNQLLQRKTTRRHSETQYKTVNVGYESLHKFTDDLEAASERFFKAKPNILSRPSLNLAPDPIPKAFTSLDEARDVIFTEGQWVWDSWLQLELGNLDGFKTQHMHVSRLLEWSMAYAEFSKGPKYRSAGVNKQPAHVLKAYREALYLIILTQLAFHEPDGQVIVPLCYPPETCDCHTSCKTYAQRKSALNAHFARLSVLAESIFVPGYSFAYHDDHSISVDSGISPPLFLGSTDCRSTKVRHQVTQLLGAEQIQKDVWAKLGVYAIAEKLGSIEEHAVMNVGAVPAEIGVPKWVEYTVFMEESKVLLRYCCEDEFGGLVWTSEWITFS